MSRHNNPNWWSQEYDTAWDRVKAAVQRDWDQTKHDFGGHEPDTKQGAGDTVAQAAGKESIPPRGVPTYEEVESAYRFGYGARRHYGGRFTTWNADLETQLAQDWETTYPNESEAWARYQPVVRRGWELEKPGTGTSAGQSPRDKSK